MIRKIILLTLISFTISAKIVSAAYFNVVLIPQTVIQGEPVMIQVSGKGISEVKKIYFAGKSLYFYNYQNKPTTLFGIDLNKKAGNYNVVVELENGATTSSTLIVQERIKYEAPLPVPEKLGGNSPANQTKVVNTLLDENTILAVLKTNLKNLWSKPFIYPIDTPIVVTDPYGYSRLTGAYTVTHKGADLRAAKGTKVVAMNRGVVRLVKTFNVYGKTIVVDHGLGVMTFYMHLSKIYVSQGQLVSQGQQIGLSGDTGYAESPHLHITVRIGGISIDPIKFLDLFK